MSRITEEDLRDLIRGRHIDNYVETGTWEGEQLKIAVKVFANVWGVELNPHYAELSQTNVPEAMLECGDSVGFLRQFQGLVLGKAAVLYLDAHFCILDPPVQKARFPLWEELATIRSWGPMGNIIIVDDVHTFGKNRPELKHEGWPDWESVTPESLNNFFDREGKVLKDGYVIEY